MKKIDLHVQLEGSINIEQVNRIINNEARPLLIKKDAVDIDEYESQYNKTIKLLQTRQNILDFCDCLIKDLQQDNIIYAEVHFCPYNFTSTLDLDEVMEAIIDGIKESEIVKIKLILCLKREYTLVKNLKIVKLAKKYSEFVGGLSLIGDATRYKLATFKQLFDIINIDNIPFTIDVKNYEDVELALSFGTKRLQKVQFNIDNSIDNDLFKDKYIEMAPTCDIDSRLYSTMDEYPFIKLQKNNLNLFISTINRTLSNITLEAEYGMLKENFKITNADLKQYNINAINAAFLTEEEKDLLKKELNKRV